MTPRKRRTFSDGPPKWVYTAWGVTLATGHLALAGFGIGRFFDLWPAAWQFYSSLLLITSASAVAIHLGGKRGAEERGGAA